jgi:hypothetical protein
MNGDGGDSSIIVFLGLFSSGSTWACNVGLNLLRSKYNNVSTQIVYSDDVNFDDYKIKYPDNITLIKTHFPSHSMINALKSLHLPLVLTIRDPRDAAVSLMQRFNRSYFDAASEVAKSASAIVTIVRECSPLVLRYEDGFTSELSGIEIISQFLGVDAKKAAIESVSKELSPSAIRKKIKQLELDGVFDGINPAFQFDPETLWSPRHVGDGLTGKYKETLSSAEIGMLEAVTRQYMQHFEYKFDYASIDSINIHEFYPGGRELVAELESVKTDLICHVKSLQADAEELRAECNQIIADRDKLRVDFAAVLNSTCWRITAPIRWIGRISRAISLRP